MEPGWNSFYDFSIFFWLAARSGAGNVPSAGLVRLFDREREGRNLPSANDRSVLYTAKKLLMQCGRIGAWMRVPSMRLRALESALLSKKARQALVALADESVFCLLQQRSYCLPQHRILPRNGG